MIPEITHREFVEAGFYRIFQPAYFGGLECDYRLLVDLSAELGRGCGSSTWVFTNLAAQSLVLGSGNAEAQDDVWGDNPEALMASGFAVQGGAARQVDGGVVLDGLWSFSSGVDYCDWLNLQIFLPREGEPPEHRFVLVPQGEFEVIDDWNSTGLLATGSKSVLLKEVFVSRLPDSAVGQSVGRPLAQRGAKSLAPVQAFGLVDRNPDLFRPGLRHRPRRARVCREGIHRSQGRHGCEAS